MSSATHTPSTERRIQNDRLRHLVVSVIAGGGAGTVEVLTMYPLDLVKTQAQLNTGKSQSIISTFSRLVSEHGVKALYRGIASPVLAEAPKRALKFTSNEIYKPLFHGDKHVRGAVFSGMAAGVTETFINCPFELVKVRMQSQANLSLYKNTADAVVQIVKNESIFALYKGLESQSWRNCVWNGSYFGLIFATRNIFPTPTSKSQELLNKFLSGFIGGSIATTLNTPLDVVKSRIQDQKLVPGQVPKYNWAIPSLFTVAREEGISALYKGYLPRLIRLGPGGGIMIICFNFFSDLINPYL